MRINAILNAATVKMLYDGACSAREISDKVGLHKNTVNRIVSAMRDAGIVYVAEWKRDAMSRARIPAFQLGRRADAERPAAKKASPRRRKNQTYEEILDLLRNRPMSALELLPFFGKDDSIIRRHLSTAHRRGVVHIHSWRRHRSQVWTRVFAAGPGPDAKKPRTTPPTDVEVLRAMGDGQCTAFELQAVLGYKIGTVRRSLVRLRRDKLVRIASWTADAAGALKLAVYTAGDGRDAKRTSISRAELSKRYRAKRRLNQALFPGTSSSLAEKAKTKLRVRTIRFG